MPSHTDHSASPEQGFSPAVVAGQNHLLLSLFLSTLLPDEAFLINKEATTENVPQPT